MKKVLDDKSTPESISMEELLSMAKVSHDIYQCGLKMCSTGTMCCDAEETVRILDQYIQSRCHQSVESQHGSTVHPGPIYMCDVHCLIHAQK